VPPPTKLIRSGAEARTVGSVIDDIGAASMGGWPASRPA
jgi:hypothetical protein